MGTALPRGIERLQSPPQDLPQPVEEWCEDTNTSFFSESHSSHSRAPYENGLRLEGGTRNHTFTCSSLCFSFSLQLPKFPPQNSWLACTRTRVQLLAPLPKTEPKSHRDLEHTFVILKMNILSSIFLQNILQTHTCIMCPRTDRFSHSSRCSRMNEWVSE